MRQIENSYVQVRTCVRDSIKGRGQVIDCAIVQVIKAHADCSKSTKFKHSIMLSTIPKMLDSKLACDLSDICAMQVQGSYMCLYVKCAVQRVLRPTKPCALNSECELISDMRLITRKYGSSRFS